MEHKSHGGNELIQSFKTKLENDIRENFQRFQQENESKRKFTEVSSIFNRLRIVLILCTMKTKFMHVVFETRICRRRQPRQRQRL